MHRSLMGCSDIVGWTNNHNATCLDYGAFCTNGAFKPNSRWASGANFNYPESNCCACGGGGDPLPPPPPPMDGLTTHKYELHLNAICRGADRTANKVSLESCEEHCASRKCACSHFSKGQCRFTYTFLGLLSVPAQDARSMSSAFVRPGAADEKSALKAAAKEKADAEAAAAAAAAKGKAFNPFAACGTSPPAHMAPGFYMYAGPTFEWGARLAACYQRKNGRPPWAVVPGAPSARRRNASLAAAADDLTHTAFGAFSAAGVAGAGADAAMAAMSLMGGSSSGKASSSGGPATAESGPAPHADLSHSLWLHSALVKHRKRVLEPERAALYVVPAFGSLSEATGSCEGTSHADRMKAAAEAIKASQWFARAPTRHVVFAGASSEDRLPLGELGAVLSKGGAIGVCTMRAYCSERFTKRAEVPMLPLLPLMDPKVSHRLAGEACPKQGAPPPRRRTLLFFRGAHGTSTAAQELRARLWELRTMAGVDIKFSAGGPTVNGLATSVKSRLSSYGWTKDVRMPFNVESYTYGMLHSDFCAIPRGEGANPGRRMIDAVAAGCIPLIIGDTIKPPLSSLMRYDTFTVRVPESEFMRYPRGSITDALNNAAPRLGELRRALIRARDDLLLGAGSVPLETNFSVGRGADMVLLKAGQTFCPRTPASLKACTNDMV